MSVEEIALEIERLYHNAADEGCECDKTEHCSGCAMFSKADSEAKRLLKELSTTLERKLEEARKVFEQIELACNSALDEKSGKEGGACMEAVMIVRAFLSTLEGEKGGTE